MRFREKNESVWQTPRTRIAVSKRHTELGEGTDTLDNTRQILYIKWLNLGGVAQSVERWLHKP